MKSQFIGVSAHCKHNCLAKQREEFGISPHVGQHHVLSNKDYVKKLANSKILTINETVQMYSERINNQIQKKINQLIKYQEQSIEKLVIKMFKCIIAPQATITKQIINNFMIVGNLDHQKLTCQQIYQVLATVGKQPKNIDIQSVAQQFYENFQNNLSRIFNINNQNYFHKGNQIFNQQIKQMKQLSFYDQSEVIQFQKNEDSFDSFSVDISFSESQKNNFYSSNLNTQKSSNYYAKSDEKSVSSNQNLTIINQLVQLDQKQECEMPKRPKGQIFFNNQQSNKQKQSIAFLKNKKLSQESNQKQEKQKKEVKKQEQIVHKAEKNPQRSQHTTHNQQLNSTKQTNQDITKSYVDRKQGRYFIKVAHLCQQQYKKQKATFNIKLKVVQQVMFRLFTDSKSKKTHRKAKFVGGDQTGFIVCYTNYFAEMRKGQTIVLYDCELSHFYNRSYQIISHKCKPSDKQKIIQKINMQLTISRFQSTDPLIYSVQKYDDRWPSILGISHLAQEKSNTKPNIIAKVQQIVYYDQQIVYCYLYDGTGNVYAQIVLDKETNLEIGKVYYFKNIQIVTNRFGKNKAIYFKARSLNQKNASKKYIYPMDEFKFDEMIQPNISNNKKIDSQ